MATNPPTAREFANAPRQTRRQPAAPDPVVALGSEQPTTDEITTERPVKRSVLALLMELHPPTAISFKTKARDERTYSNGTVAKQMAEVTIPYFDPVTGLATRFEIRGAKILKKTGGPIGKDVIYELQMPSMGQKFHTPVFDTDSTGDEDDYNRWRAAVAGAWKVFRAAEKKVSGALRNVSGAGVTADADEDLD